MPSLISRQPILAFLSKQSAYFPTCTSRTGDGLGFSLISWFCRIRLPCFLPKDSSLFVGVGCFAWNVNPANLSGPQALKKNIKAAQTTRISPCLQKRFLHWTSQSSTNCSGSSNVSPECLDAVQRIPTHCHALRMKTIDLDARSELRQRWVRDGSKATPK
jgi:hypothetical protein